MVLFFLYVVEFGTLLFHIFTKTFLELENPVPMQSNKGIRLDKFISSGDLAPFLYMVSTSGKLQTHRVKITVSSFFLLRFRLPLWISIDFCMSIVTRCNQLIDAKPVASASRF